MSATTTTNGTEVAALRRDVDKLRQTVSAMQADLAQRDEEQMTLEGAVEFMYDRQRILLSVLGSVIKRTFGDRPSEYDGPGLLDLLYGGERHELGFRQAPAIAWNRPKRRWGQFGSKADLLAAAAEHDVAIPSRTLRAGREWIIRELWKHRALPGSVALHRPSERLRGAR